MLFNDLEYFHYTFPEPQYLGAKNRFRSWIGQHIPDGVDTVLDAFSGSQSIAFLFKQLGLRTITNDFLNFNHQIGLALIENRNEQLDKDDLEILFRENTQPDHYYLMEKHYSDIFFEKNEAVFLDCFRANIQYLSNQYKQSIAIAAMNRSMTRKVTMGHFAHTQALNYAANSGRIKRNRSLVRPLKDIFWDLLPQYNRAVFDNGQKNLSYCKNILDLLPELDRIDLAYFDPPYCNSHADYQSFYHLLETYTENWKDKKFINNTKRYDPKRISGFDKKSDAINSFKRLFTLSQDIPCWLISYNDRSFPDIETFVEIITYFRPVKVETKIYANGRGGKGSVAGSREVLLICHRTKSKKTQANYQKIYEKL
ncbi:MAG: DNA adenine methylase [Planctomycetaceae bacterium]|nr:DNA adenine methylase [Planctomycetaceae bacterium]